MFTWKLNIFTTCAVSSMKDCELVFIYISNTMPLFSILYLTDRKYFENIALLPVLVSSFLVRCTVVHQLWPTSVAHLCPHTHLILVRPIVPKPSVKCCLAWGPLHMMFPLPSICMSSDLGCQVYWFYNELFLRHAKWNNHLLLSSSPRPSVLWICIFTKLCVFSSFIFRMKTPSGQGLSLT